jgi:hypothetical protein
LNAKVRQNRNSLDLPFGKNKRTCKVPEDKLPARPALQLSLSNQLIWNGCVLNHHLNSAEVMQYYIFCSFSINLSYKNKLFGQSWKAKSVSSNIYDNLFKNINFTP